MTKKQKKKNNTNNKFQANSQFNLTVTEFENFSLAFSKGISVEIRNRKNCAFINRKYKKVFLQQIIEKGIDKKKFAFIQNQISKKLKCVEEYLQSNGFVKIVDTNFVNISRLCVGLGAEHVFETSLTLDYIWGIPYLPSSAIKGVCRSAAFWEIVSSKLSNEVFSEKDKIEDLAKQIFQIFYNEDISFENNKQIELDDIEKKILLYKLLFGTQNFEGLLTFLDAYPQNILESKFELDIINPHYPDYYKNPETNPAGDWYEPRPVNFLTVGPRIKFRFTIFFDQFRAEKLIKSPGIGIYAELLESLQKDNFEALKEIVKNILKVSLTFHGIGAKTRLGYGLFDEVK